MATIAERLAEAAVTDSLNRAENPIGSPWVKMNPGVTAGQCATTSGGGYSAVTNFAGGEDDCYYSTSAFLSSSSQYIYGIVTLSRIGTNERQSGLWLCRDETNPAETQNGYLLRIERRAGAGEIKFTIEKWAAGASEVIKEVTTSGWATGARVGFVVGNSKAYLFTSATEGGTFEELASVSTTTYKKGYSGLRAKGTGEFQVKDFRTGTFSLSTAVSVVRQFTTSPESQLMTTAGTCFAQGVHDRTVMLFCKPEASEGNLLTLLNKSGETRNWFPSMFANLGSFVPKASTSPEIKLPSGWALLGYSKAGGNVTPRAHVYDFVSAAWTHRTTGAIMQEEEGFGEVAGAWFKVKVGGAISGLKSMKMQVAALVMWDSVLTDEQVEQLPKATSISAWASLSPAPKDLILFNQAAVSEPLEGFVGTIEQLERLETSVVSESPPIRYSTSIYKYVKVLVSGAIKEVKRWILVGGQLVSS